MKEVKKKIRKKIILKSVLKCIESIRIKNRLNFFIILKANLGGGGPSKLVKSKLFFNPSLRKYSSFKDD